MTTTTIARPQPHWLTLVLWLLVNVLSLGLVGAMFHNFPLAFTFPPNLTRLGTFSLAPALLGGVLFGFVPALLIGFLQRLILRPLLRRSSPLSRWWIISTSMGIGLMHFLADGFENARDLSVAVILGGLAVGVVQWQLVRMYQSRAVWLIPINTISWYMGWLIGIAILQNMGLLYRAWTPDIGGQTHGILGLSVGATFSLSIGLFWMWLLRNQSPTRTTL